MYQDRINLYFSKLGYDVCYNTLNNTESMVRAYVKDFQEITHGARSNWSHYAKPVIYNTMYNFEPRQKRTGFESFKKIDQKFRKDISPFITQSQLSDAIVMDRKENSEINNLSYKEALKQRVKQFKNPLVYFSGGLDSELVCNALLDSGVKFTPVVFEFLDNNGKCQNEYDIKFAYSYCAKHGLYPLVKKLNIEELWNYKEFVDLAIELQLSSPQLVTHVWMVKEMCREHSDRSHVLSGEVRFHSNHMIDNDVPSNMILLNKAAGLGADGLFFVDDYAGVNPAPATGYGAYLNGPGDWDWDFLAVYDGAAFSPAWYTVTGTPSALWYYNVTNVDEVTPLGATATYPSPGWNVMVSTNTIGYIERTGDNILNASIEISISVYGDAGGVGSAASAIFTLAAYRSL